MPITILSHSITTSTQNHTISISYHYPTMLHMRSSYKLPEVHSVNCHFFFSAFKEYKNPWAYKCVGMTTFDFLPSD